jgi:hypothetical protein
VVTSNEYFEYFAIEGIGKGSSICNQVKKMKGGEKYNKHTS